MFQFTACLELFMSLFKKKETKTSVVSRLCLLPLGETTELAVG